MPKRRTLNGIPGNLAQSYLSTLGYYDGGYMADWINYIARENNLSEIEIDIITEKIEPKEANIKALKSGLKKLNGILTKELTIKGYEKSFIKKAKMKFEIPITNPRIKKTIYCYPFLVDQDGNIYKPKKRIVETAYEVEFNLKNKLELKYKILKDKITNN
jgi:hypothetical protein